MPFFPIYSTNPLSLRTSLHPPQVVTSCRVCHRMVALQEFLWKRAEVVRQAPRSCDSVCEAAPFQGDRAASRNAAAHQFQYKVDDAMRLSVFLPLP